MCADHASGRASPLMPEDVLGVLNKNSGLARSDPPRLPTLVLASPSVLSGEVRSCCSLSSESARLRYFSVVSMLA